MLSFELSYLVHIHHQLPSESDRHMVRGGSVIVKSCTWTTLEAIVMVLVLYIAALGTHLMWKTTFGCGINLSHISITIQLLDLLCCIFCFASHALGTGLSI